MVDCSILHFLIYLGFQTLKEWAQHKFEQRWLWDQIPIAHIEAVHKLFVAPFANRVSMVASDI